MSDQKNLSQSAQQWFEGFLGFNLRLDPEILIYLLLIILAVFTRFVGLEARVMSHDENTHVYFSWLLEEGRGYSHDPLSHGPLQFHLVALSYFLFGDNDATARYPAALFGVIAVAMIWALKRWLGRTGALVAGVLLLISPYMLFYARYVRNEALVVPMVMATIWAMARYVETKQPRWLYLLAFSLSLHYATKETSFIFTGLAFIFLAGYLSWGWITRTWQKKELKLGFTIALGLTAAGLMIAAFFFLRTFGPGAEVAAEALEAVEVSETGSPGSMLVLGGGGLALIGLIVMGIVLWREFGQRLRTDFPTLDMLIVIGTVTLPQLSALPAKLLGWDPLAYQDPSAFNRTTIMVIVLMLVSVLIGVFWDWRRWLVVAAVFFIPFTLLYTTLFTNGQGMATGLVGSLGYWLVQHRVERGSQPQYYYILVQLPLYEYLPVMGTLLAGFFGLKSIKLWNREEEDPSEHPPAPAEEQPPQPFPMPLFLAYLALASLTSYSVAGERMPWITVHITLPLILLAGWGIGKFLDGIDWGFLRKANGWIVAGLLFLGMLSLFRALGALLGPSPPFQGKEISQLSATSNFLAASAILIVSAIGIVRYAKEWTFRTGNQIVGVLWFGLMVILTARTAFRAAYINYDDPTEFLVYAHSARGPKTALKQIEELSIRTTGQLDIKVAYDNESTYPFWWYLRHYRNAMYFGSNPSRDLLNYPLVLVGDPNWSKVEELLANNYYSFEYQRIWWPMQDYYNLTWDRIREMVTSPDYRAALWEIWIDRDYTRYGEVTGRDYSLTSWSPSNRMKLYVRKDVASLVWDYGVAPAVVEIEPEIDPYAELIERIDAHTIVGRKGTAAGEFTKSRDVAIAPDGAIYVADTLNHRIQKFSPQGDFITAWGQFANLAEGPAPGGTFNEPWGITIAPDGSVYVADTWNHRIQHFTAEGEFIAMFGFFGQGGAPDAFWGPRDVLVDANGRIYVADTGNKRIAIFDGEGVGLGEFGGFGLGLGNLDEPVGLGMNGQGQLYVVDTWNQRIQVFEDFGGNNFTAIQEWPISGWIGQSLENKPYIAVNPEGIVCTTDPEGYRVLCFNTAGEFLRGWGEAGVEPSQLGLPVGIAFDSSCSVWVMDSENGRLMFFDVALCE
jgi:uncharacterized protein (TIGR03663 family)